MLRKSKFLTFVFSLIPGVGHLYLGLMKRGLLLLIGTFAAIYFITVLPMVFPFVLAVIWFYGMFDALQKVSLQHYYHEQYHASSLKDEADVAVLQSMAELDKQTIHPMWLGIGFIAAGLLVILAVLAPEVLSWIFNRTNSTIALAVLLIGVGVAMIYSQYAKRSD